MVVKTFDERLAKHVLARKAGRELATELVNEYKIDKEQQGFREALVEQLTTLLCPTVPVAPTKPPNIKRLGRTVIPFGQHKGKVYDEIPLDYLDAMLRLAEQNVKDLRAYLTHPELKSRRQSDTNEDE